jgi:glycosyltransferase involved in cell wall biosynthesis
MQLHPMPLISIITPFFNAAPYLKETIESVLAQSFINWELILVDDGSTDESTNIAKQYAHQNRDKIFYLEHEGHKNRAAAASRNLGLTKAKGDLVALLDADDLWLPDKLAQQVSIFEKHSEIGMLCEASKYWYSWNNSEVKDRVVLIGVLGDQVYQPLQLAKELYPLGKGDAPCPCSIVIKMSTLKVVGGFEEIFKGQYQVYEDQAFLIKIYLREAVYISSQCNNWYRQRPGSVMETTAAQGHYAAARYFFLQWLQKYLTQNRIDDDELESLLRHAIRPYKYSKPYTLFNNLVSQCKNIFKSIV